MAFLNPPPSEETGLEKEHFSSYLCSLSLFAQGSEQGCVAGWCRGA